MDHYRLWGDDFWITEFGHPLDGDQRYAMDYIGAAEDSRREKEYLDEQRENRKMASKHPGVQFCETDEEYEDNAEDARERLKREQEKRAAKSGRN